MFAHAKPFCVLYRLGIHFKYVFCFFFLSVQINGKEKKRKEIENRR